MFSTQTILVIVMIVVVNAVGAIMKHRAKQAAEAKRLGRRDPRSMPAKPAQPAGHDSTHRSTTAAPHGAAGRTAGDRVTTFDEQRSIADAAMRTRREGQLDELRRKTSVSAATRVPERPMERTLDRSKVQRMPHESERPFRALPKGLPSSGGRVSSMPQVPQRRDHGHQQPQRQDRGREGARDGHGKGAGHGATAPAAPPTSHQHSRAVSESPEGSVIAAPTRGAAKGASPLNRLLHNHASLRQAIVLSEVLSPPLALRQG